VPHVVADDRPGPVSNVSVATSSPRTGAASQSASFGIGALSLELSAAPGAARLVVSDTASRDIYVVDPSALASWSSAVRKLLDLATATNPSERVEFRTPFLIDREGRASIAFEGLVSELGLSYRLLVNGAEGRVAGVMTTSDVVRGVAEAAGGAVLLAQRAV
jgi:hypothetical protein